MCGGGSLGSHSHTVNGLNKPEPARGADALCAAAQKEHFAPSSPPPQPTFDRKILCTFCQKTKVFPPFFIDLHRNGAFHCQIKQLEETSAIASKVKLQDLHWKLKRAFCANVLLIKPKAHLQILLKINHNMTNSSWHHSNKFNEQKPLHARIIKFFDGKVFFCFFFYSAHFIPPLC